LATRIPIVIKNWYEATMVPRISLGCTDQAMFNMVIPEMEV
jgi:hypothetical protein